MRWAAQERRHGPVIENKWPKGIHGNARKKNLKEENAVRPHNMCKREL